MVYEFEHYLKNRLVKKSTPNKDEAKALLNRAKHRLDYIETQTITEENALFVFEDIYEAIREAVQSLMSLKGFKPYSHEALVAFLTKYYAKTFTGQQTNTLNRYRIIRNNVVYRASSINKAETEKALKYAYEMIKIIEETSNNQ